MPYRSADGCGNGRPIAHGRRPCRIRFRRELDHVHAKIVWPKWCVVSVGAVREQARGARPRGAAFSRVISLFVEINQLIEAVG